MVSISFRWMGLSVGRAVFQIITINLNSGGRGDVAASRLQYLPRWNSPLFAARSQQNIVLIEVGNNWRGR